MDLSFSEALNRLLEVLKFRTSKRKALLAEEFDEFCDGYGNQQRYLVEEIDKLVHFFELQQEAVRTIGKSNAPEATLEEMEVRLRSLQTEIERRRQSSRADRMAIHAIAADRQNYEYFKEHILNIVSDDERELFRTFYELVSGSFERLDGAYLHDLSSSLYWVDGLLTTLREARETPSADIRIHAVQSIESTLGDLKTARENCQNNYTSVVKTHAAIQSALRN